LGQLARQVLPSTDNQGVRSEQKQPSVQTIGQIWRFPDAVHCVGQDDPQSFHTMPTGHAVGCLVGCEVGFDVVGAPVVGLAVVGAAVVGAAVVGAAVVGCLLGWAVAVVGCLLGVAVVGNAVVGAAVELLRQKAAYVGSQLTLWHQASGT
jgi:hypothetical protein